MKLWRVVIFTLAAAPIVSGEKKVDIFGYFESQLMGARIRESFIQLHSNKLRVDLEARLSENVKFGANFDYITYHGKTRWNILEFLPKSVAKEACKFNLFGVEINPYVMEFRDKSFLDNGYLRLSLKYFDITVGKQQISLGTGYAWNPVDIFNTKDLLDPTYEQPGHDAVRLDLPLGSGYSITALCTPEDEFKNFGGLVQLKGYVSHFDIMIIAGQKLWNFHDYTKFNQDFFNPGFQCISQRRTIVGFSTAGELFGLGLWSEYGYNRMEISEDFQELVVGIDYTFDFQTYMMIEYYRNTLGKSDCRNYSLNDWMRFLASEQKAIARDQVYFFMQHPVSEFLNVGLSTIYVISDNSMAIIPTMIYNIYQNVDITAYLNFYFGRECAAFNKNFGNGGMIRARVYF